MPDISVLIVNYNGGDVLPNCLDSVLNQQGVSYEVLVIDNASQDHSHEVLQRYDKQITTVYSPKNLGFGKANNQLAKLARGTWLYLLNPDASLTKTDDLLKLRDFMLAHSELGLAGTRILQDNKHILPQHHYQAEHALLPSLRNLPGDIAWVLGASMMIKHPAFTEVSGFDGDFFLYGEETDLCMRLRMAGYAIGYCEEVEIEHLGGYSEAEQPAYDTTVRKQRALHLLYHKHYCPKEVKKLLAKTLWRARYRYLWYKMRKLWRRSNLLNKECHYKAIIDTTKAVRNDG